MAWDYTHGSPPRWDGDPLTSPMTVPTLAEQTAHGHVVAVDAGGIARICAHR